jgi:hypothetical protein
MYARFKKFLERNERPISSLALLTGFIFDSLTLRRVDLLIENAIFISYLFLTAFCIFLINLAETGKLQGRIAQRIHPWLSIIIQFALGNLFSGFTVFYFRSSAIGASWPFLLFLAALMIANESLKKHYVRLIFQTGTLFIALFSYAIFILPVIIGKMGDGIFLLSGALSLVLIILFIFVIKLFTPSRVRESRKGLIGTIGGIYLVITLFYFTNILPPIPLALKEIGVYQNLEKQNGAFVLSGEQVSWWREITSSQTVHAIKGDPLYVYSAVFSPAALSTNVVHHWMRLDEKTGKWISISKIQFGISGGRDGGYRGYSFKQSLTPGHWRVNVETSRGQLIGSVKFNLEFVDALPSLETTIVK